MRSPVPDEDSEDDEEYYSKLNIYCKYFQATLTDELKQEDREKQEGVRSPVPDEDSEDDEEYYSKLFGCNFRLNMGRTPTPDECASDDEVQCSLFITHLVIS